MLFESFHSLTVASLTQSVAAGFFVLVRYALEWWDRHMLIADSISYLPLALSSIIYTFTL